jgi:hypothetical protein
MDTIVSNLPMAMGTDEQQSLHPFFRQGQPIPCDLELYLTYTT